MVASFTFTKLREMAAAAKALARYVDDLESELEASDDLVVEVGPHPSPPPAHGRAPSAVSAGCRVRARLA